VLFYFINLSWYFNGLTLGSRSSSDSSIPGKQPHAKRVKRWNELNDILAKNRKHKNNSTAYSYITWNDVKSVFNTVPYTQEVKEVPDNVLEVLSTYLKYAAKVFGSVTTGNEAHRLHLISPIIVCVCSLFEGDITIDVEEDLNGDYIKAHGHFEFVLRRGDKRVCIVEAKKDDMEQGMAQDLLGCEVAADIGYQPSFDVRNLNVVCGIVTNYCGWNFLRSLDEKIELEECTIDLEQGVPTHASLLKISGKIYKMLSD
jgi:hypothetical protein